MQSFQRVGRVALVLVLATGLVTAVVGAPAVGAEIRPYVATAEANGMYARYGIPGFLIVENYVDGGGPVAQATQGSDGTAQSFASLPYPGPAVSSYPLVVVLVTGSAPPGYPLSTGASHPTQPEGKVADPSGTYSLETAANGGQSSADARVSPGGEQQKPIVRARSQVVPGDGGVTASAESLAEGITVGPLSVGLARSSSVTTYREGDSEPVTKTELVVEGGRAGDATFSFGRDGLKVAQQGVPLPADQGLAAINQALGPAGVSVHFQEATRLTGGAAAAALEIVSVADVPGAGKGTLRLILGGATSFVALGAEPSAPETFDGTAPSESQPQAQSVAQEPAAPGPEATTVASSPTAVQPVSFLSPAGSEFPGDAVSADGGASNAGDVAATPAGGSGAPREPTLALPPAGLATSPRDLGATSALAALLLGGGVLAASVIVMWATRRRRPWMV